MRCDVTDCRDNNHGICICKYPAIGSNRKCIAYIPVLNDGTGRHIDPELEKKMNEMTNKIYEKLGIMESIKYEEQFEKPYTSEVLRKEDE